MMIFAIGLPTIKGSSESVSHKECYPAMPLCIWSSSVFDVYTEQDVKSTADRGHFRWNTVTRVELRWPPFYKQWQAHSIRSDKKDIVGGAGHPSLDIFTWPALLPVSGSFRSVERWMEPLGGCTRGTAIFRTRSLGAGFASWIVVDGKHRNPFGIRSRVNWMTGYNSWQLPRSPIYRTDLNIR